MKIELEIVDIPEEILEQICPPSTETDELTPKQRFMDWLETAVRAAIETEYDVSGVDEDIEIPDVYAKEIK